MAFEFLKPENNWRTHCGDQPTFGRFSTRFDFPTKAITQATDYPSEACKPWMHYNMALGNLIVLKNQGIGQTLNVGGVINTPKIVASMGVFASVAAPFKLFDIKHPLKVGKRLRHASLEGPEIGVYTRGILQDGGNTIELPDYWKKLVDPESITVNLTPIGVYQELYYEMGDWSASIKVVNNNGGPIKCSYMVYGERIDVKKLEIEYEEGGSKE